MDTDPNIFREEVEANFFPAARRSPVDRQHAPARFRRRRPGPPLAAQAGQSMASFRKVPKRKIFLGAVLTWRRPFSRKMKLANLTMP